MPKNEPVPARVPTVRRRWLKSFAFGAAATLASRGLKPDLLPKVPANRFSFTSTLR